MNILSVLPVGTLVTAIMFLSVLSLAVIFLIVLLIFVCLDAKRGGKEKHSERDVIKRRIFGIGYGTIMLILFIVLIVVGVWVV